MASLGVMTQEMTLLDEIISEEIRIAHHANSTAKPIKGRILSGKRATADQFPFAAWLDIYTEESICNCGGTLISRNFVLSSARCVDQDVRGIDVHLGSVDRNMFPTTVAADAYVIHPSYINSVFESDISLIRTKFSVLQQVATLPPHSFSNVNLTGLTMETAGWGVTDWSHLASGYASQYLMYTTQIGFPLSECQVAWSENFICARGNGGSSTSNGDTGGPLIISGSNRLVGVVNFDTAHRYIYNRFVRVDRYLDWISSFTGIKLV